MFFVNHTHTHTHTNLAFMKEGIMTIWENYT